ASDSPLPSADALLGLATWALQWTPRVALLDEAVVMELAANVRLFGGKRSLRNRFRDGCVEFDVAGLSWAPNSLAALVLGRTGLESGFREPLDLTLDRVAMDALSAVAPHHTTLTQLGCKTLGDIRKLPRGGVSRRFDKELLGALDRAYGLKPEAHEWVELPDVFKSRLELMSRVDLAPALLFGARRLLVVLAVLATPAAVGRDRSGAGAQADSSGEAGHADDGRRPGRRVRGRVQWRHQPGGPPAPACAPDGQPAVPEAQLQSQR
ncbi:MAG TPA: hypothetical protein VLA16_20345, partial [Ideonella sp.]|nr:hypothetical protein [Ideonella sp.]